MDLALWLQQFERDLGLVRSRLGEVEVMVNEVKASLIKKNE